MPRISRQERDRNRERLIGAVARQLADPGHGPPTVSSVSAEAGIARTAFYNYFADLEELFRHYVDRAVQLLADELAALMAAATDPMTRMARFVEGALTSFADHGPAYDAAIDLGIDRGLESTEDLEPLHRLLSSVLRDGVAAGGFSPVAEHPLVPPMILQAIGANHRRIAMGETSLEDALPVVQAFVTNSVRAR